MIRDNYNKKLLIKSGECIFLYNPSFDPTYKVLLIKNITVTIDSSKKIKAFIEFYPCINK